MTRRVDDVDLVPPMVYRQVLREDGNSAFPFQVVAVHDPFRDCLVLTEYPGVFQHGIHQRSLSMVDVGDDGDVSDSFLHVRLL